MDIFEMLVDLAGKEAVIKNEPMKNHTSFKTGGCADYFISPKDGQSIIKIISALNKNNIKYYVFGNGSNMLVSDRGIEGAVIYIGENLSNIEIEDTKIIIGAGTLLSSAASAAQKAGLSGFEFASGIPGSFGGAVFMNAGAYGGEIKDVIEWVNVIDDELKERKLYKDELDLGYRTSIFQKKSYIILNGCISLKKDKPDDILSRMNELSLKRREKQPLNYPSAGSTFKRPEGYFAGKLIEDSGLKGKSVGGAQVSEKHAGFIVNTGSATTDDILELIKYCQDTVYEKFGVNIEPEVRFIGRK